MFTKEKENSLLAVAAIAAAVLIGNAIFGGERYNSVREIPLSSLCAELARRI
jgi:hypothetical protein